MTKFSIVTRAEACFYRISHAPILRRHSVPIFGPSTYVTIFQGNSLSGGVKYTGTGKMLFEIALCLGNGTR